MSVKMLLRSSSTPLLSSLSGVTALHHSPTVREVEREKSSVESPRHPTRLSRSVSYTNAALASAATSPIPQHVGVADDARSVDGSEWDFCADVVPWPKFRRAQSEGDLESLSGGSSALIAAAESLVTSPSNRGSGEDVFDAEHLSTVQRQWSRRMSLRRQSSLSVIPSNSDSGGSESDDIQDAGVLIHEPGSAKTDISGTQNGEEEAEVPDYDIVDDYQQAGYDAASVSLTDDVRPNSVEVATNDDGDAGGPYGLESEFRFASEGTEGYRAKFASVSGRDSSALYNIGDGECYSSISTAADGTVLVCNSRGCKPVSQSDLVGPMFIAGGLGIGGGGGGGRNLSIATDEGDSLGADAYYKRALEANPGHPLLLRNYANFLHEVKRDTAKAESFYERAILANPGDGELLGQYAKLMWDFHKDEERAGAYFEQALQASPDNCYVIGAYAAFLWSSDCVDEAQEKPIDLGHCSGLGVGVAPRYSSVTAG